MGTYRVWRTKAQKALGLILWGLTIGLSFPSLAYSQDEAANLNRYLEYESSARHYEQYEVKPSAKIHFRAGLPRAKGIITLAPVAGKVRIRTYLADSHMGLKFYDRLTCIKCHPREAQDLHTTRLNLTCRQCHGPEPIAGIKHYYSPMNNIRRHAYVCSKCHPEATVSFSEYIVHEPSPLSLGTFKSFPLLFVVFWIMVAIAAGTFAAFLPHTFMWGLRELLSKIGKKR